jgi:hypothetical protein
VGCLDLAYLNSVMGQLDDAPSARVGVRDYPITLDKLLDRLPAAG